MMYYNSIRYKKRFAHSHSWVEKLSQICLMPPRNRYDIGT